MKSIQDELKLATKHRGSLQQIALTSGISQPTISRIANGHIKNPSYKTVWKITRAIEKLGLDKKEAVNVEK